MLPSTVASKRVVMVAYFVGWGTLSNGVIAPTRRNRNGMAIVVRQDRMNTFPNGRDEVF